MTLPSIVASISKVLILGIGCHLLIPGTAYAQPFDPQEIDRFLRSAPLDVYVSGEGEPGSPVSTMEFLGDGVLLVAGLASHVDALYWTMMPIEDSIYLTMGFDDEPEPHPVDYLLVVGFEGESLVLEADPSHYDAFTITLSRGPTAHPAATHPEALVGAWIVE